MLTNLFRSRLLKLKRRMIANNNTLLMERFEKEDGLEYFDEQDSIKFLLDLARCPGDRTELSGRLLDTFGSLKAVLEARKEQLQSVHGIGNRTAIMIRSILPFTRVWERMTMKEANKIANVKQAEQYCKSLLYGLRNEHFYVICLNSKCHILGKRLVSEGSLSEVNAYPRIVMETALNYNSHSILICHNHPGGTDYPSNEDIASTVQLKNLLNGVGIMLLDHIIIAGCASYSMVQHGDIDYKTEMRR